MHNLTLSDIERLRVQADEAEVAFDDFLRLYPASDNVSYALSRKGDLLSRQVRDPARDQTKTLEAVKAFTQGLCISSQTTSCAVRSHESSRLIWTSDKRRSSTVATTIKRSEKSRCRRSSTRSRKSLRRVRS